MTETPYPNLRRNATAVPRITQATSNNWLGPDALWAMVRTLENPSTTTPLQQQHLLQPHKQWYWLDNRSYCTDLEQTIQCLEASEPRLTRQRKRARTPNQDGPSQKANTCPVSSSTSLQPKTNHRRWFCANPEEHLLCEPSLTLLQNWVTTYEPMIRACARIQQQLNQQGLTAIDEAFEHANSLGS
jgi:hypothetical protein